jgi:hypothetical protein
MAAVSLKRNNGDVPYGIALYLPSESDFYLACELKFQLNSITDDDETNALTIIIQLDDLWTRIVRG